MAQETPEYGLTPGTAAPSFSLPSVDGTTVTLAAYRSRQPVLLVFYRGWW